MSVVLGCLCFEKFDVLVLSNTVFFRLSAHDRLSAQPLFYKGRLRYCCRFFIYFEKTDGLVFQDSINSEILFLYVIVRRRRRRKQGTQESTVEFEDTGKAHRLNKMKPRKLIESTA